MGQGNPVKCGVNKAQVLADNIREVVDVSEEWLGKGMLTDAALVGGDLILPVQVPALSRKKAIAKRVEDVSESSHGHRRGADARSAAEGPYEVGFADEAGSNADCKRLEVRVGDGPAVDGQDFQKIVIRHSTEHAQFEVTVRMELASVRFKKAHSPFHNKNSVDETVKSELAKTEQGALDLRRFAENYGNCLVEKVFCGGVISLRFRKVAPEGGGGDADGLGNEFDIQMGRDNFNMNASQRGGPEIFKRPSSTTLEKVEKEINHWRKNFGSEPKKEVVRLKLAPFSNVEGINVPSALQRMDFDRLQSWEKASEALRHANKTRRLADLRAAVQQAVDVDLEDESLAGLQDTLKGLNAAVEALKQASENRDIAGLKAALSRSEEARLPEWERSTHDEALALVKRLETEWHDKRMRAASDNDDVRVEDLVDILVAANKDGYVELPSFSSAIRKLEMSIADLTAKAKEDLLKRDAAEKYKELFTRIPEAAAFANINLASSAYADSVSGMDVRAKERKVRDEKKTDLEGHLKEAIQSAQAALNSESESWSEDQFMRLEGLLSEVETLLGIDGRGSDTGSLDGDSVTGQFGEDLAIRGLRRKAHEILQHKRDMDEAAQNVARQLTQAMQSSSVSDLEAALQELDIKRQSGQLPPGAPSLQLVDSARRQLLAMLLPELTGQLEKAEAPGAAHGDGPEALANARNLLKRIDNCRAVSEGELERHEGKYNALQKEHGKQQDRHAAQTVASEQLRHCLESGDPQCLNDALQQAQACGVAEASMLEVKSRLRELETAERKLQSALKSGDRVHLSQALEEASRARLTTRAVDDAMHQLQSSKTNTLVSAIKQTDYFALQRAITEAESRDASEVEDIRDVLAQAKEEYARLDAVARHVTEALGSLNYDDLKRSVSEARRLNVPTDDVQKAENVLASMDQALEQLRDATNTRDLTALQEALHSARQQGLQRHPDYKGGEEIFANTCMPAGMTWALEEQRHMWVVLCLRRPLHGSGKELKTVSHPFTVAVAELCHEALISPESEPYSVQYIHHALARVAGPRELGASDKKPLTKNGDVVNSALLAALEDFSRDPCDGPPGAGEAHTKASVDVHQFNNIGVATKHVGLDRTRYFLWYLVCIVEWETEHRLLTSFMMEQAGRTANLVNEAESTGRSLRNHSMALQARRAEDDMNSDLGPAPSGIGSLSTAAAEDRLLKVRGVLDEIEEVKSKAEKLQAKIEKSSGGTPDQPDDCTPDFGRILDRLKNAQPRTLDDARAAVHVQLQQKEASGQKEAAGRIRDIYTQEYALLEKRLLQLQYKGRQALDGEDLKMPTSAGRTLGTPGREEPITALNLPLCTLSQCAEAASSLQDHAFLQLLGIPEGSRNAAQNIDRCFQRVEVYERFGAAKGAVEDEFEKLCREAVAEARQRCGGRRLIAALKPLMVDLVKRRQKMDSSLLNTLRNCGLDQVEKVMLRKHLQPRDLLIALAFSSMQPGPSQARMMSLSSKTDSPLPFLFGWAQPPVSDAPGAGGLQLCVQIHWGALRELFCSPSYPLVLSLGTRGAQGKSYLLQYLYALQECHFRGSTKTPLRIHSMPSIDLIGDFARESPLRGVVLADVHTYDPKEELCDALVATLTNCAALMIFHVSIKRDFSGELGGIPKISSDLESLLRTLCLGGGCPSVLLLLRDVDKDDYGPKEERRVKDCIEIVKRALGAGTWKPHVLAWLVPPLRDLGPTELTSEVKSLRKEQSLTGTSTLEGALESATRSTRKFPSMPVLQRNFDAFATSCRQHHRPQGERDGSPLKANCKPPHEVTSIRPPQADQSAYGPLALRMFGELEAASTHDNLLSTLFPVTTCHQQLTSLSQERVRCVNRCRDYLEPDERRRLESKTDELDRQINALRDQRQQAPPHALLRTFSQLLLTQDLNKIAEFGAYLDDWKQQRRAPLLETKLKWRKELDQLLEGQEQQEAAASQAAGQKSDAGDGGENSRITKLRKELASVQRRLDEVDASTDSFWLELMLWYEMERIGTRRGLCEIDERLTFGACKAAYLTWVKNGNPIHFLHSSPLQFGAFDPLRWHPQISGASLFGSDFIGDILRELDRDLGVDVRRRPLLVISVIGVQSSGKSTLMNYLFGCCFATHVGRCTKGLYISLLETKRELVVVLDTEGLLSVESRDDVFDKQVALMTMACSDLVIVNNRGELGRHVGDLFQVCLFALYHLKLARISPAIGFVLQCLSMVNQQQQYEWVATVKKSLEESVQELQQKERPHSFKLQDLVFLDSESIFVMPSAFNDDVQFGRQVSRPTNLYAMKALQLREQVFHWISNAKAMHKQRARELDSSGPPATSPEAVSTSSFASLSQWYEHARTVWQTLSMCGTDLLQFRTMRQLLMAQQLQEFCDALVQKHIDAKLNKESDTLIERYTRELWEATEANDVHVIDNAFRGQLDSLRDSVVQEMYHEFDEFVKAHDTKFTDEQVKADKRFSLMGPMRRKYASVDSLWRSAIHLALEQRSMDHLFEEISSRVNDLVLEQGQNTNVENVERIFNEKWNQVMAETQKKNRPNLERVKQEVISHFNAGLSNWKSQFRKSHIFHAVKTLSVMEVGTEAEIRASFLFSKKGVGDALVSKSLERHVAQRLQQSASTQVDNLWIKIVDAMRLEIDQRGRMSDATARKILNRLNAEIDSSDHFRQLMHQLGSSFVQRIFFEIAKATIHYRYQLEHQSFESRMSEILGKKQQKLWEIKAHVDTSKREVHCAKVWAKKFVDTLDNHFRNAVGRMAQEIVSHISNILTNPANACELAIERSFTKRNWRHVVMYAIDPTQYLFMEFHKEWDSFKQGLVDQYCKELKSNFGDCLRIVDDKMQTLFAAGVLAKVENLTMNKLSDEIRRSCEELVDDALAGVLCNCLPSFSSDADWSLKDLHQFANSVGRELRQYRTNTKKTEVSVERRMEQEMLSQKANCWKSLCGCPARCPGCGTKCNLESENHWPERAHECKRHLYPAFNGWQKQEGRRPFLLHCRAKAQWQIARTRPPLETHGKERYWDNFQEMLMDEHPDWLDPMTHQPLPSMEPSADFEEDAPNAPESVQREIEENRRAWANCKDALLEHFTSMADDRDIEWLDRFKREGGALRGEDFPSIRDELFETTPLESLEFMENTLPLDEHEDVY